MPVGQPRRNAASAAEPDEEQEAWAPQVEYPKSEKWFEEVAATHPYWRMPLTPG